MAVAGFNEIIEEQTWGYTNEAISTVKTLTFTGVPAIKSRPCDFVMIVSNPSTQTNLTVNVNITETFAGVAKSIQVATMTVNANSVGRVIISGDNMVGDGLNVTLTNGTLVSVAFTATARLRRA